MATTTGADEAPTTRRVSAQDVRDLIDDLNHYCFHAGADQFETQFGLSKVPRELAASHPEAIPDFLRCLNWSLKEAQKRIIETRLSLERAKRAERLEVEPPYSFTYLICLLTDYADSIAWALVELDLSWVRSQFLDVKKPSYLDDGNWSSVETVLAQFNADPDQIMLATDLTSFMQVGDVFLRNTSTGHARAVEIKTGRANERVLEILSSVNEEEFNQRLDAFVSEAEKPKHAITHVERTLRQHMRAAQSERYRESGMTERIDLKSQLGVRVVESDPDEDEHWADVVNELAVDIGEDDLAGGIVDECLFFEYGTGRLTNRRRLYFQFRLTQHLDLSMKPEDVKALPVFNVPQHTAMPGFMPQTMSLNAFWERTVSDAFSLLTTISSSICMCRISRSFWRSTGSSSICATCEPRINSSATS